MTTPNKRPPADPVSDEGRPPRKSTEIQPVKRDDVALETYEQSPERPGGDERSRATTPDEALPERERVLPD